MHDMEKPFIQVGATLLAIAHIVRVHLENEVRYENGRTMIPARMIVAMTAGDTYIFTEESNEGKAFRAWWLYRTTVLVPQPGSEERA